METIQVTINPDGVSAMEIDFSEDGCNCDMCKSVREKLRTFEIEYPEIKIGDYIWAESRNGKPIQLQVVGNDTECDIEAQICLMNVNQETNLLWLPGTTHTAEILETGKVKILS